MHDPIAFRSDRLPTEHFDERFSEENVTFWVPILADAARIGPGARVLDVGCGTGGFARAIAAGSSARVTGLDSSARFVEFARSRPGSVEWVVGDGEELPFADTSFDRVLLSLVLHQLARPGAAVAEAFRVLVPGGAVLVRTIAPEDAVRRIPERYIPAMAAADAARMPSLAQVEAWLEGASFERLDTRRVLRNAVLNLADEERRVRVEVASRYAFVTADELEDGLRRMRADAEAHGDAWVDPRPTHVVVASKA